MKIKRFLLTVGFHFLGCFLMAASSEASDEAEYRIVVLDKERHFVVPGALLTVFDEDRNSVPVTPAPGEFVVMLPDEGNFTLNASADGYVPIKEKPMIREGSRIIQVLMARRKSQAPTQTVAFMAKDALSNQLIGANFRIKSTEITDPDVPTVTTAAHPEFGTELRMNHRYLLKVSSENYQEYTASIRIEEKEPDPIVPRTIFLLPLLYNVDFKVRDGSRMNFLTPTRFEIRESDNNVAVRLTGSDAHAVLRVGNTYDVRVEAEGYEPFERTLEFSMPKELRELSKTVLMVPRPAPGSQGAAATAPPAVREISAPEPDNQSFEDLKVGETVLLKNVYFDQSSYVLRPESFTQLDRLVRTLQKNPKLKIEIGGHTDNVGDERLNLSLSQNRAKVIASYLANKGIAERRLLWKGFGPTHPIAPNDSEKNKARNRRVEFMVLEN